MMSKLLICAPIFAALFVFSNYEYNGSTIASVNIAGGIVKAQHINIEKKYKRSECPVCKGKGWYISGDSISKVPCGYCEPESSESQITHPPIIIKQDNHNPNRTRVFKK